MTNKEMIFCVLKEHTKTDKEQLAILSEWKDKQFVQEKEKLIDNVCEWIKNNIHDYMMTGDGEIIDTFDEMYWLDDMFGDLKESMKEV